MAVRGTLVSMCGRYVNVASTADLAEEFDVEETLGEDLPPSWNVAPTDPVRIVVKRHPTHDRAAPAIRQLRTVDWGLLPSWSKSRAGGAKMINARSETVTTKMAFKAAAARRRCAWPRPSGTTSGNTTAAAPSRISSMRRMINCLPWPALYEIWRDDSLPEDDPRRWVWTCSIITRAATDIVGEIHDRCPVLVPRDLQESWLDCSADDPRIAEAATAAMPEPHLEPRQVPKAVGNVKNNGPELIEATGEQPGRRAALQLDDAQARRARS